MAHTQCLLGYVNALHLKNIFKNNIILISDSSSESFSGRVHINGCILARSMAIN